MSDILTDILGKPVAHPACTQKVLTEPHGEPFYAGMKHVVAALNRWRGEAKNHPAFEQALGWLEEIIATGKRGVHSCYCPDCTGSHPLDLCCEPWARNTLRDLVAFLRSECGSLMAELEQEVVGILWDAPPATYGGFGVGMFLVGGLTDWDRPLLMALVAFHEGLGGIYGATIPVPRRTMQNA
jgi:hypothetical protein